LLEKYPKKVKLVLKSFPLTAIHPSAYAAAVAALAANAQGRFWEFHDKLFENQKALNDAKIQEIAKALKLDMERFNRDMQDPAIKKVIARDMEEGDQAGIEEIPTVFINGKLPKRGKSIEDLIEAELRKDKK
jgi:protein-disulfide isomerase